MTQDEFINSMIERRTQIAREIQEIDLDAGIVNDLEEESNFIRNIRELYSKFIYDQQHNQTP